VLRTFKRKTLRTGILGQKSSATRAQEERDLLRALSEFPPQALNAFDDTFALLDGGVGVAVSAAMARRAALYSKNEQVVGFQLSDADAKQGTTKKDFQGSEPFLEEVVNQLVKPKKIRVKADGITKQGKMPVLPRRPSEDRRRLSTGPRAGYSLPACRRYARTLAGFRSGSPIVSAAGMPDRPEMALFLCQFFLLFPPLPLQSCRGMATREDLCQRNG